MRNFCGTSIDTTRWILGLPPRKYGYAITHKEIVNMLHDQVCISCQQSIDHLETVIFIKNSGMQHLCCIKKT